MMRWNTYFLLFAFIQGLSAHAQQAGLSLSEDSILIGQQVDARIWVEYEINDDSVQVIWPTLADSWLEGMEIISKSTIDTLAAINEDNPLIFRQEKQLTLTAFDSGFYAISPLIFVVNGLEVATPANLLSVYYPNIDIQAEIKDIKDIFEVEFTWKDWLALYWRRILAILGLGIVVFLIVRGLKRRTKIETFPQPAVVPKVPAHIIALEKLDILQSKKLWQNEKLKGYYSELTEILREYLENRYDIKALEETSDEILLELTRKAISTALLERIQELLMLADLVKFAKEKPLPSEHERAMGAIRDFIQFSKIEEGEIV